MPRIDDLDQHMDDEALARALQEEFSRESRQRTQQRHRPVVVPGMPVAATTRTATAAPTTRTASSGSRRVVSRNNSTSSSGGGRVHGASVRQNSTSSSSGHRQAKASSSRPREERLPPTARSSGPAIATTTRQVAAAPESDEAMARRLERAFRNEERALQQSGPAEAAVTSRRRMEHSNLQQSSRHPPVQTDEEYSRRLEQSLFRSAEVMDLDNGGGQERAEGGRKNNDDRDAELARELQRVMDMEEAARQLKRSKDGTPLTSRTNSETSDSSPNADYDLAVKMEQELMDERIARQLASAEQQRISQEHARRAAGRGGHVGEPVRKCSCHRVVSLIVPTLLLSVAAAGVMYYFLREPGSRGFFPSPEDFRKEDPFTAQNATDANRWRSDGEGLSLEVVRATDPSWYDFFYLAVDQWDNGTPDALTLSTSATDYDFGCEPINYKLKVCNGDYGDTRWKGINKVLLMDGFIFASAARMNEFYLKDTSDDQKTYTMCHEVGHGFGLPHTDENFGNADLGNCMDYTNNPSVNMQPDVSNYKFLAELYGTVPGSPTLAPAPSAQPLGGQRSLSLHHDTEQDAIPEWIMDKWRILDDELELHSHGSEKRNGWRMLHQTERGEAYELDIGEGYSIRVEKLLA